MTFTTRPVALDDLALICTWPKNEAELHYCFPKGQYPLTEYQLAEVIEQRAESTVACVAGHPTAFANFYRWEHGVCAIGNVIVCPDARRTGAARYLIEHLCFTAFSKYGASEVHVACFNGNTAGLLLYPQLGFQPFKIEERRNRHGDRLALIHLRRSASTAPKEP